MLAIDHAGDVFVGGVARRSSFEAAVGAAATRSAIARGRLTKVAHGWYAEPGAAAEVVRAVGLGGQLACLSAARQHGLWTPHDGKLHLSGAAAIRASSDVVVHPGPEAISVPLPTVCGTVRQIVRWHDAETGLICLESALNQGKLTIEEAAEIVATASVKKQPTLSKMRSDAQSGTETRVRLFFQRRGVPVRPQAFLPGIGYVDLLVGTSLIVEMDSVQHHTSTTNYRIDRNRDLEAHGDGFRVVRLTYEQVFVEWRRTQQKLSTLLRRREHRRRVWISSESGNWRP